MKKILVVVGSCLLLAILIVANVVQAEDETAPDSTKYVEVVSPFVPEVIQQLPKKRTFWDMDAGARKSWGISDNSNPEAKAHYLKGEIYPLKVNAKVRVGVADKISDWEGRTPGKSDYDGQRWQIGPAVKILDESRDVDAAVFYGRQKKSSLSHDGDERRSSANLVGVGVGTAFYGREDNNELWFPRTEVTGEVLVPFNQNNDDTNSIINIGVRQFVYDPVSVPIRTFAGAGFQMESPADPKLGIYAGAQDNRGVLSVEVGPRINLENGATIGTVGANLDLGRIIRKGVSVYRNSQVQEETSTSSALGME
jgi:hypothetical protein